MRTVIPWTAHVFHNRYDIVSLNKHTELQDDNSTNINVIANSYTNEGQSKRGPRNYLKKEKLRTFHQNVQCLSNCKTNLEVALGDFSTIHIIGITEHWQSNESIHSFQLEHYNLVSSFCRSNNKVHGGVALYALQDLVQTVRHDINAISEEYVFECTAAEIKIKDNSYICVVVYKPPNTTIDSFIDKMQELLEIGTSNSKKKWL